MRWLRHDKYAELSEDGWYSVAAFGTGRGWIFEGYRTRKHPEGPHLVCTNQSADEARRLCEEDAREA